MSYSFIERFNRLNLDLLHLVVLQLPQTDDVYSQHFVNTTLFECFSNNEHPKYRAFRCVPYLSSIRDHFTVKTVRNYGSIIYKLNGELHREGDLPAIIHLDGTQEWFKNGHLHRDGDLPAVIWAFGYKAWYKNGQRHREGDLPAIIHPDGNQYWYENGIKIKSLVNEHEEL